MSVRIQVRDYRGCETAVLECAPIAIVAGKNAQGKTSVVQAVTAALTGDATQGLTTKGNAGWLVRTGAGNAAAAVARDSENKTVVTWPDCSVKADGTPPVADTYAAGVASVLDLDAKGRAKVLSEYLHSDPTKDDFAAAMGDAGLDDEKIVVAMWKSITEHGWDAAHELRKTRGAEYKGQWREIAGGKNYGSRIAEAFEPDGWSEDLMGQTDRELEAAVADARVARDRAIAGDATNVAHRETVTAEASKLAERRSDVVAAEAAHTTAKNDLQAAQARLAAMPPTQADPGMPCPHCGERVVIVQVNVAERGLAKPTEIDPAELKKRRDDKASLSGEVSSLAAAESTQAQKLSAAKVSLEIAQRAGAELAALPAPASPAEGGNLADADATLAAAEKRLAAFKTKNKADEVHARIGSNELVMAILAPNGLRAKKLGRVLDAFNETQLAPISAEAGWKPVTVAADMSISYGGRPSALLSASEQYRVRAVLQIAMAKLGNADMIVIDAADILDGPTREGLIKTLRAAEIPALVAMTMSKPEQVPNLSAIGWGKCFWVEAGLVEEMFADDQRKAAAE